MTSSRKKHHPPGAAAAPPVPVRAAREPASVRQWVIRIVALLGVAAGLTITLIGATPGIAGGWGKLLMMAPGMVLAAGSFIAFIETTPLARSRRRGE